MRTRRALEGFSILVFKAIKFNIYCPTYVNVYVTIKNERAVQIYSSELLHNLKDLDNFVLSNIIHTNHAFSRWNYLIERDTE
jgi:hypothetical protein